MCIDGNRFVYTRPRKTCSNINGWVPFESSLPRSVAKRPLSSHRGCDVTRKVPFRVTNRECFEDVHVPQLRKTSTIMLGKPLVTMWIGSRLETSSSHLKESNRTQIQGRPTGKSQRIQQCVIHAKTTEVNARERGNFHRVLESYARRKLVERVYNTFRNSFVFHAFHRKENEFNFAASPQTNLDRPLLQLIALFHSRLESYVKILRLENCSQTRRRSSTPTRTTIAARYPYMVVC